MAFGSGAMTNSIDEISDAECIFVIGSNTTENHPVIALEVKKGDRVLIGKYAGTEIKIEGTEYLIVREDEVLGVVD